MGAFHSRFHVVQWVEMLTRLTRQEIVRLTVDRSLTCRLYMCMQQEDPAISPPMEQQQGLTPEEARAIEIDLRIARRLLKETEKDLKGNK